MKTRLMIPALLAAAISTSAFARDGNDRDRDSRYDRQRPQQAFKHAQPRVVVVQPRIQHRPAPRVVHRTTYVRHVVPAPRVVYRVAPPPPHALPVRYDADRAVAQTVGAVSGGIIGNQVGNGHLAPTLVGAVIGGIIGDQFARY